MTISLSVLPNLGAPSASCAGQASALRKTVRQDAKAPRRSSSRWYANGLRVGRNQGMTAAAREPPHAPRKAPASAVSGASGGAMTVLVATPSATVVTHRPAYAGHRG